MHAATGNGQNVQWRRSSFIAAVHNRASSDVQRQQHEPQHDRRPRQRDQHQEGSHAGQHGLPPRRGSVPLEHRIHRVGGAVWAAHPVAVADDEPLRFRVLPLHLVAILTVGARSRPRWAGRAVRHLSLLTLMVGLGWVGMRTSSSAVVQHAPSLCNVHKRCRLTCVTSGRGARTVRAGAIA